MLVKPEPLPWKDPENEPENIPVPEDANEAVVAKEALVAKEAVPNKEPVNCPVNDPENEPVFDRN